MDSIRPQTAATHKNAKCRVRVAPQWLTSATEFGTPRGLPLIDGGRWAEVSFVYRCDDGLLVIEPGPTRLPQVPIVQEHHGYGAPRLVETEPERVEFVARAVDLLCLTQNEITRRVSDDGWPPLEAEKRRIGRRLSRGRERLRERGVLPWAAFGDGVVPTQWWLADEFVAAIDRWRRDAVTRRAPASPGLAQQLHAIARSIIPGGAVINTLRALPPPAAVMGERLAQIDRTPWRPPQ